MRCAAALVLLFAASALACVWDRDTIRDETRELPGVFELITGQFEHHGKGYYEARLAECRRSLGTDSVDVGVRNDMGVALIKLARYEESMEVFQRLEKEDPKRYETLSNMGVLLKKMGRYAEAAEYTRRALEIKPEGHLGMKDTYVKMLSWRAAAEKQAPTADFLGRPYAEWSRRSSSKRLSEEDFEHLKALIRSDRSFADAHLVLGDELCRREHLNLAFWAWTRALQLGHPAKDELRRRLGEVYAFWRMEVEHHSDRMVHADLDESISAVTKEIESAASWQITFEKVEGELVASNPKVQFEEVAAEMAKRGIDRVKPSDHGLVDAIGAEVRDEREADERFQSVKAERMAAETKRSAEANARLVEDKQRRVAETMARSKRNFAVLFGAGAGVSLLAVGLLFFRRA